MDREFHWIEDCGVDRYVCGDTDLCLVAAQVVEIGDGFSHLWVWRKDSGELLEAFAASSKEIRKLAEAAVGRAVSQPYAFPDEVFQHMGPELTAVDLPVTPEEWVELCQQEGDLYLGGCCDRLAQAQDILNTIFRKGGLYFHELGLLFDWHGLVRGHQGYMVSDMEVAQEAWYDPVARLIYLCEVLKEHLGSEKLAEIASPKAPPKDPLQEVQALTRLVRLADLFEDSHSDPEWRETKKKELIAVLKTALVELEGEEAAQG